MGCFWKRYEYDDVLQQAWSVNSRRLVFAALLYMASPAVYSEVTAAGDNGFSVHHTITLDVGPAEAYRVITDEVGSWWIADHTWSGDSANLSIDARGGGCFCERLADGGSMQHMQVTWAQPGKELRMTGGLGPLQMMGVHGGMQWLLKATEKGSILEYNYVVSGFSPDGLGGLAPIVDAVQGQQLEALRAYLARKK